MRCGPGTAAYLATLVRLRVTSIYERHTDSIASLSLEDYLAWPKAAIEVQRTQLKKRDEGKILDAAKASNLLATIDTVEPGMEHSVDRKEWGFWLAKVKYAFEMLHLAGYIDSDRGACDLSALIFITIAKGN